MGSRSINKVPAEIRADALTPQPSPRLENRRGEGKERKERQEKKEEKGVEGAKKKKNVMKDE